MTVSRALTGLARSAARRPLLVVAVALVVGIVCGVYAVGRRPSTAADTFVDSSSSAYKATERYNEAFGEEPIEVLVRGNVQRLLLSSDLEVLAGLEGCLSGNVPVKALPHEGGVDGPCGQLRRLATVKIVLGPGTFVAEAATVIDQQLNHETTQAETEAREARRAVELSARARGLGSGEARALGEQASKVTLARFKESIARLAFEYDLTGAPSLEDPNFIDDLVFDSAAPAGTPKQRFAYLFPSPDAALVSVRLRAGLTESQRTTTIDQIKAAVAMSRWRLSGGETYTVTGEPVIVSELAGSVVASLRLLAIAILLVMAVTLGLVFVTGRPRLAPLVVAVVATAVTFAVLTAVWMPLTVASVAVVPVLIGLAVDYCIQFQSRFHEASRESAVGGPREVVIGGDHGGGPGGVVIGGDHGSGGPEGAVIGGDHGSGGPEGAAARGTASGGPTIATAALASCGALLALELSPVPMVRDFGLALILGLVVAFLCALTVGSAISVLVAGWTTPRAAAIGSLATAWRRVSIAVAPTWRGAQDLVVSNPFTRVFPHRVLDLATRRPGRVLAVGALLAAIGWGVQVSTPVQTDVTKLVPQSLPSLRGLDALERISGVGGEIDLMVSSAQLTRPAVIEWMSSYQNRVLKLAGYSPSRGCGRARLCPAFSLPDLFDTSSSKLKVSEVDGLLAVIPSYFSRDVITPDRRTATLAFGIRTMSLQEQNRLIDQMRAALDPPPGVSAELVGLPVLAAQSGAQVASSERRIISMVVGLAAVALILMIAFRSDPRRTGIVVAPIALATGWSALILFVVGVALNPMSVALGVLVIAVSTEFSVLLAERHHHERSAGHTVGEALRRSYRLTGAAVGASATTAILGFAVLMLSNIAMLRDFGVVTVIDLTVSLLGVLIVLPAAVVIAEGREVSDSKRPSRRGKRRASIAGLVRVRSRGETHHETA